MASRMARLSLCVLASTLCVSGLRTPAKPAALNLKSLGKTAAAAALAAALNLCPSPAAAENELAAMHGGGFDSSLIDTTYFTEGGACAAAADKCVKTGDCRRGMTCTAKCLGDNACITGCFAKYGNEPMNDLLECSIEKHACIKVAILPPGPDTATAAPAPPLAPVADFKPRSLEGTWYKVMGWNNRYDCFDCQRNSFAAAGPNQLKVDVEFSMPRPGAPPTAYPLRLSEKLVFDGKQAPADLLAGTAKRHARTEGHMFGLTFWENWSVIGQNRPGEPEFKFVHYSGRTSQNTYEGAFVYAREPRLPPAAKASVYAIARAADMRPADFCAVRNDAKTCGEPAADDALAPAQRGLFMGAAAAAEVDEAGLASDREAKSPWRTVREELASYAEDPHVAERWVFSQQQKMGD